jgi:AraC-like DNA-binding protein
MTTTDELKTEAAAGVGRAAPQRAGAGGAVQRHEFRTADADTARRFFETAYHPGWQLDGLTSGADVVHQRIDAVMLTLDAVCIPGEVTCTVRAGDRITVIQPREGTVRGAGDDERPNPREPLLAAPGLRDVLELADASFDVVSIDSSVIRTVAADLSVPLPNEIRFLDRRPRSAGSTRTWHRTFDYVSATFASADTAHQPLMVGAAARAVAAAILECFASSLDGRSGAPTEPAPALSRAVEFIHRKAMHDIGITDIADAVHLTPRAVQYLFRRQFNTTPTEYLRQVRLHRAHQDLIAGEHAATTVGSIATKWGFAHTGRFAVLYRQTYGQSPHTTLRA